MSKNQTSNQCDKNLDLGMKMYSRAGKITNVIYKEIILASRFKQGGKKFQHVKDEMKERLRNKLKNKNTFLNGKMNRTEDNLNSSQESNHFQDFTAEETQNFQQDQQRKLRKYVQQRQEKICFNLKDTQTSSFKNIERKLGSLVSQDKGDVLLYTPNFKVIDKSIRSFKFAARSLSPSTKATSNSSFRVAREAKQLLTKEENINTDRQISNIPKCMQLGLPCSFQIRKVMSKIKMSNRDVDYIKTHTAQGFFSGKKIERELKKINDSKKDKQNKNLIFDPNFVSAATGETESKQSSQTDQISDESMKIKHIFRKHPAFFKCLKEGVKNMERDALTNMHDGGKAVFHIGESVCKVVALDKQLIRQNIFVKTLNQSQFIDEFVVNQEILDLKKRANIRLAPNFTTQKPRKGLFDYNVDKSRIVGQQYAQAQQQYENTMYNSKAFNCLMDYNKLKHVKRFGLYDSIFHQVGKLQDSVPKSSEACKGIISARQIAAASKCKVMYDSQAGRVLPPSYLLNTTLENQKDFYKMDTTQFSNFMKEMQREKSQIWCQEKGKGKSLSPLRPRNIKSQESDDSQVDEVSDIFENNIIDNDENNFKNK